MYSPSPILATGDTPSLTTEDKPIGDDSSHPVMREQEEAIERVQQLESRQHLHLNLICEHGLVRGAEARGALGRQTYNPMPRVPSVHDGSKILLLLDGYASL